MEPSSCLGPHQRARVAIEKDINIKTDDNAKVRKSNCSSLAQNNTLGNGKRAKTHHTSKGIVVKRASKKMVSLI
jgi:hypothetical protein